MRLQGRLGSSLILEISCGCSARSCLARSPDALALVWAARIPSIVNAAIMVLSVAIIVDFACEAGWTRYLLASGNYIMRLSSSFDLRAFVEHTISSV